MHSQPDNGLLKTFLHNWQSFFAFTVGFITILVCWINHHAAFEYINKVDTKLMWINGFLLFVVTLTPFPTAILAEYLQEESTIALAVFGFNYVLISIAANGICTYAYNHHFIEEEQRKYYYSYTLIYRYAILYTLVAFFLCFVSIIIPLILYTILFAVFAAPKKLASRLHRFRTRKKQPPS